LTPTASLEQTWATLKILNLSEIKLMSTFHTRGWMLMATWLLSVSPALAQLQPVAEADAPAPLGPPVAAPPGPGGFGPVPGAFEGPRPPIAADGLAPVSAGSDRVRVSLSDNSQLIGQLSKEAKFEFKSKFGKLALTISEVTRIEESDEGRFTITLENGDRMTGEVDFGDVKLKTAFGEVPLARRDFMGLEVGKLYEHRVAIMRPSPDGRTTVTVYRQRQIFQPHSAHAPGISPYTSYAPTAATYIVPDAAPTAPTITPPSALE
jgi:hypothetical protein